jgi:hypothetical protein
MIRKSESEKVLKHGKSCITTNTTFYAAVNDSQGAWGEMFKPQATDNHPLAFCYFRTIHRSSYKSSFFCSPLSFLLLRFSRKINKPNTS